MANEGGSGIVSISVDNKGNLKICVYNDRTVGSNGVWFGDNPFHFVLPVTLMQVFMVVVLTEALYFISRPLRTPKFVCASLGGIILGPSLLGKNKTIRSHLFLPRQIDALQVASLVGVIYYIFIIALKMDLIMTLRSAKRTWKLGLIPFMFSFWVMIGLFSVYHPQDFPGISTVVERIIFCGNSSFSNFAVISQSLLDSNLITSELGQIALSSAMVNDIVHAIYIVFMYLQMSKGGKQSFFFILLTFWAFMFCCIFIIRPAMLMIARRTPIGKPVRKAYLVFILLGVIVMAFITDFIGLSFLYGPLFFGLVTPNGPPLATTIIEKTEVIIQEFFLPLAFAYLGIKVDVFALQNLGMIIRVHFIVIAGYLAKILACIVISLTYKIKLKHGLVLGLILNMKGIMELIIYSRMRKIQLLDDQIFCYLTFCVLGMTAILTPCIELLYKPHTRLDNFTTHAQIRTIQNTYGNSEFRVIAVVHNEGNVRSIISLIEACNPMLSSPICAYVIHLVELLGKSTPFLLPVDLTRRRFSSFNFPLTNHIMRAFDNYSCNSDGLITIQPYINVAPFKNMHEKVCNLAQDKLVSFLIIPFHENDQTRGTDTTVSLRDLNSNFQAYARCTVGILVDRYSQLSMGTSDFYFHVGIFFVGGPDDREALALGNRMSERMNMRVTVFWFVLKNSNMSFSSKDEMFERQYKEENEWVDSMLDESYIDEFKAKNIGNGNVVCQKIMVDDCLGIIEAIRGLEGNYDLVIVGRKHNIETFNDREMSTFMENVEILGMFGDILASTEFCNGMIPVLVVRCGMKPAESNIYRVDSVAASHRSLC